MAARQSNGTGGGNWSSASSWSGGVVPVEGDSVTILSSDTITLDGTYVAGDDTITAIQVNGTLKASRTTSSQLTVKGQLVINNGGTLDFGKSADQIPLSVKVTLLLNYSAALSGGKWGLDAKPGAYIWIYGASRTLQTTTTSGGASGANTITVAAASNWAIGDTIAVGTSNGYSEPEAKTITGISGNVITVNSNFTYNHVVGVPVGHFTGNITFAPYNNSYQTYVYLDSQSPSAAGSREIQWLSCLYMGNQSTSGIMCGGLGFRGANSYTTAVYTSVANISLYQGNTAFNLFAMGSDINADNIVVGFNNTGFYTASGAIGTINNSFVIHGPGSAVNSSYSQGGVSINFNNSTFNGCNTVMYYSPIMGATFTNCNFDAFGTLIGFSQVSPVTFVNCNINKGVGTPTSTTICSLSQYSNGQVTMNQCNIAAGSFTNMFANPQLGIGNTYLNWFNKNGDPLSQELYTIAGNWFRDNSTFRNSTSSLRYDASVNAVGSYSIQVLAANGTPLTIDGSLQYNSAYVSGSYTLPSVTVSGLGITPVTFQAASGMAGQWQPYSLNFTQNSGADGLMTVTFNAQSGTSTGSAWFDGVVCPPNITSCRFYGTIEAPTAATRTTDPYVVATYSQASAMTGISLNYSTKTITVTQNHSLQDLYDYSKYSDQLATNLTQPVTISTENGTTYTLANGWNMAITGCVLSGSGDTITTTGNYTTASGGYSTATIVAANTTQAQVSVSGAVSGSTIQIYDTTSSTELFNGVSTSAQVPFTSGDSVRIRVRKAGYIPYEYEQTVGIGGVSLNVSQQSDTIYNANGIDGSTITDCAFSGSVVKVYVSEPTNQIDIRNIYAWYMYTISTPTYIGMQPYDVTAQTQYSYVLNSPLAIHNQQTAVLTIFNGNVVDQNGTAGWIDVPGTIILNSYYPLPNLGTISTSLSAIQAKTDNLPDGIPRNQALDHFSFVMFDTGGNPKAGLTVTAQRSIDGSAFAPCANTVTELGDGFYLIDLAASDLDGTIISLRCSAPGAKDTAITLKTQT